MCLWVKAQNIYVVFTFSTSAHHFLSTMTTSYKYYPSELRIYTLSAIIANRKLTLQIYSLPTLHIIAGYFGRLISLLFNEQCKLSELYIHCQSNGFHNLCKTVTSNNSIV